MDWAVNHRPQQGSVSVQKDADGRQYPSANHTLSKVFLAHLEKSRAETRRSIMLKTPGNAKERGEAYWNCHDWNGSQQKQQTQDNKFIYSFA